MKETQDTVRTAPPQEDLDDLIFSWEGGWHVSER